MPYWTTHELRRLDEAHRARRPTKAELAGMFPRHSLGSICNIATKRGLRKPSARIVEARRLYKRNLDWLKVCHRHFARREAEQGRAGA